MPASASKRWMSFSPKRATALGVEAAEGLAEGFALAEDGDPGEACLEAVEHERLPEGTAVALGGCPTLHRDRRT